MCELLDYLYSSSASTGKFTIIFNVILASLFATYEFRVYMIYRRRYNWAWIKLAYSIIGFMWAIMYAILLFLDPIQTAKFGAVFVRPGITVTLSVLLAGAYWKVKCIRLNCKG